MSGSVLSRAHRHGERFPQSRFVGYDLGEDAVAFTNETVRGAGLDNIRFETRDLTGYDERERFDLITSFDAVHYPMNVWFMSRKA